jgi:transposase
MLRLPATVEPPVYGWERLVLLRHLLDEGLKKTDIAARLGVSRGLIYHWLRTGQLDRELDALPAHRTRVTAPAKLAPFEPIIDARLATYPELSAVRLYDEVRAAGYAGGLSQLKCYVRRVRPRPPIEPVVRFETAPGHQAQVDFAEVRFPWGKRSALLVVLGYSRLLWVQFYRRQTMATVIHGLETAFAYLGGVPRELLFDQLKAVIIDDTRPGGGKVLENPEFLRFAAHWDFRIRACRPYRAKTKGKVERPVHYLRHNFVYGREFLGDADLNAQCLTWLDDIANVRVHGTTHERPRERFERDERTVLGPLAPRPYQSLVLAPERSHRSTPLPSSVVRPLLTVERRPLAAYARLAEHAR